MAADHILVLAAVEPEIQGVLDRITHPSARMIGGRSVRCGRISGMPLRVVVTGPGILNTVQAITACVENARPLLIFQAGCGGGFRQLGMVNGDIAVATAEVDVHLGIETGEHHAPLQEMPFPVLESDGKAFKENYPLDLNLAEAAFLRLKAVFGPKGIEVFKGPFITGSTVTGSEKRAAFLFRAYSPCMESMEGAGAAFLSHYYQLPLLEIRCVSNMVGKRDLSQWDLSLACRRAGQAAADIIEFFIKEQHDNPVIPGLFHLPQ
ncbi:MAG: futalosine hydrolase [Deltaproteobacteria bacterium]|nr:futalosine hydrolase [Deltaproteobacteria bacterium]